MRQNIELGQEIAGFRLDALLGRGGMATVYKVWNINLHRYEAMKVLPPQLAMDSDFVERFLSEARTAARLRHHNIVPIHTVSDPDSPQPYFTMQVVEGGDLGDLIDDRGAMPLSEVLPILRQTAAALDYAHDQGVIHRDVKPGNMLLEKSGSGYTVMVMDFGIARAQEASGNARLTKTGMIVGTPEYMSPEQAGSGPEVDRRSDQYSLGIVAYELLVGSPPFGRSEGSSAISVIMSHIRDAVPPIAGLPKSVYDALTKALSKDPNDRFSTCSAFVDALEPIVRPVAPSMDKPSGGKKRWPLISAVAALMFVGSAMLLYGIGKPIPPNSLPPPPPPGILRELKEINRDLDKKADAPLKPDYLLVYGTKLARLQELAKNLTEVSDPELRASGYYFLARGNQLRAMNYWSTQSSGQAVQEVSLLHQSCAKGVELTNDFDKLMLIRDVLKVGDFTLEELHKPANTGDRAAIASLMHQIDSRGAAPTATNERNRSNAN